MNVAALFEVEPSCFVCSVNHRWKEHARAGFDLVSASRMDAQILMQRLQILFCRAMLRAIHREHPPVRAAAERGVICVVIEYHDIARGALQRDAGWEIARWDAEESRRLIRLEFLCAHEVCRVLAARNDAQTPGFARQCIEIKRNFTREKAAPVSIGMPSCIAGVVVAIAACVVKILAEYAADKPFEAFII